MTRFTIHMGATDTVLSMDLVSGTVSATWAGMATDIAGTEVDTDMGAAAATEVTDTASATEVGMDTDMAGTAARSS